MIRTARLTAALALALIATPTLAQRGAPTSPEGPEGVEESIRGFGNVFQQIWVPRSRYASSPQVRAAFRPVIADIRQATVQVRSNRRRIAYGGIVGPDGWVVTKASLIRGPVTCRLRSGRELDARVVGVDRATDLAMLKIDAKDLPVLDLSLQLSDGTEEYVSLTERDSSSEAEPGPPTPGDLLATVGLGRDPIAVGVLSVLPRPIDKRPGLLGVMMDIDYEAPKGEPPAVRIETIQPGKAADEAGLLAGDLILSVDGVRTPSAKILKDTIGERNPGDRVELEVVRGEETLRFTPMLRAWAPNFAERRAYSQNKLGSELSERRFGFPAALQHDTVIDANDCGGPLVDLHGRVVGFNISRAGRTETYALPTEMVRDKLLDLMSGRLTPVAPE